MSIRYIHQRFLPDKAIDLIDEAAAKVNLHNESLLKLDDLKRELNAVIARKEDAAGKNDFEEAANCRTEELRLQQEIDKTQAMCTNVPLTREDIAQVELATDAPESLQRETAEGLTLEGMLGTEAPEEGLVERIALREAIDQLPEKERMTILLRYFRGMTQEQTARVLGVSQVQISRLEHRGLKRLRESFEV